MKNISYIDPTAEIAEGVEIGPFCMVGKNVKIGKGCILKGHNSIEDGAILEEGVLLYPFSFVSHHCHIKKGSVLYPHACLGSPGFGFASDKKGEHHYIPQIGTAILEENVKIGCHVNIDRGALIKSQVGSNSQIGAFSHLAHNVILGKNSNVYHDLVVAGSTTIGDNFHSEGKTSVNGHIKLGDQILAKPHSAFNNSEEKSGAYQGFPHEPVETYRERLEVFEVLSKIHEKLEEKKNEGQ